VTFWQQATFQLRQTCDKAAQQRAGRHVSERTLIVDIEALLPSSDGMRACVSVVLVKPQAPAFGGMRPGVVVRANIEGGARGERLQLPKVSRFDLALSRRVIESRQDIQRSWIRYAQYHSIRFC
jgi:hypothetical protein